MKPYILIVDDQKITTKLLRRYVENNGYEAAEAYDGIECLEKVNERKPDVIILDVMMPRMDGYETAKALKSQDATKDIPVVIVTALNDVHNQIKSMESGADDFLSKPIEEKLLISKIKLLSDLNEMRKKNDFLFNKLDEVIKGQMFPDNKTANEMLADAGF